MNALANVAAARTRLLEMNLDGSMTCTKGQVAQLLGVSERTFDRIRGDLKNFPGKLPGIERWSRPAVVAWISSNGQTTVATPRGAGIGDPDVEAIAADLEADYGRSAA